MSPLDWAVTATKVHTRNLKKGDFLFRQGEISDVIGYVKRGLIYTYYVDQEGKQYVKNFAWEGRLISPYAAIISKSVCQFSGQALEDTTAICLPYKELETLYDKSPAWERIGRKNAEKLLIERELREYQNLCFDTKTKYDAFVDYFHPIKERVPQYIIASYLGVTPVALSRVLNRNV